MKKRQLAFNLGGEIIAWGRQTPAETSNSDLPLFAEEQVQDLTPPIDEWGWVGTLTDLEEKLP